MTLPNFGSAVINVACSIEGISIEGISIEGISIEGISFYQILHSFAEWVGMMAPDATI